MKAGEVYGSDVSKHLVVSCDNTYALAVRVDVQHHTMHPRQFVLLPQLWNITCLERLKRIA